MLSSIATDNRFVFVLCLACTIFVAIIFTLSGKRAAQLPTKLTLSSCFIGHFGCMFSSVSYGGLCLYGEDTPMAVLGLAVAVGALYGLGMTAVYCRLAPKSAEECEARLRRQAQSYLTR